MVKVQYDPPLLEEVVLREIRRREETGDLHYFRDYHDLMDPIYEKKLPPDAREREFQKIHAKYFADLGYGQVITDVIQEFSELGEIEEVCVRKTASELEEGADLSRDRKCVGIKVRPERFSDVQGFYRGLRHEFRHVADILDETFGHPSLNEDEFPGASPAEANLIQERYRTVWDIYVDGRLTKEGKETVSDQEGRLKELEALYRGRDVSSPQLIAAFGTIWGAEKLTHAAIMEMARDPDKLFNRGGAGQESVRRAPMPGSPCPLCRFPTFHWADGLRELPNLLLETIRGDFPAWEPEAGACGRCIEVYKATVRV